MRSGAVPRGGQRPFALLVAGAVLLPLMYGGAQAAAADAKPPPGPEPKASAGPPVPLKDLVPGIPLKPYQRYRLDTPDQALPPVIPERRREQGPPAEERRVPPAPPSDADLLVEYVPKNEVVGSRRAARCTPQTGPYQREVEKYLKLPVDGKQSKADCKAIRAWQVKEGMQPAIGFAGPTSWAQIRLRQAKEDPNAAGNCPVVADRVACLDLPSQLMWVQKGEKVIFGPVSIRSGRKGYATRVGWNEIYWRNKDHWSTIYDSPMPFAQFFNGGQAFHGVYGGIHDPEGGSHGCVNLRYDDAKKLWSVLKLHDRVFSWGRRTGT